MNSEYILFLIPMLLFSVNLSVLSKRELKLHLDGIFIGMAIPLGWKFHWNGNSIERAIPLEG